MPIQVTADLEATVYADADAADAVADLRVGGAAFKALEGEDKDRAAATATADLDTVDWIGERVDPDQLLAWPRTGTDFDEDAWPQRVIDAAIELMFSYVPAFATGATIDVLNPDAVEPNIKREKVGPLDTEYFAPRTVDATALERFPAVVQRLLAPLVRTPDAAAWGTGASVRTS